MDRRGLFAGYSIVVGVTGGIAAYKTCQIVSSLRKEEADVYVVMTKNACEFVAPLTLETLSGNPCVSDTFEHPRTWEVEHIALAKRADLILIAPATANFMAKLAHGIADDMLSTTCLASKALFLLAPAMNTGMWEAAATQMNIDLLKKRGIRFIGPESGMLACGDVGVGRMSEPDDIVSACVEILLPQQDMKGLNVLITAGPTREYIDPVRYITNRSSGKMGYALAEAALRRGAKVTLVSGPVFIDKPAAAKTISVTTTEDLKEAVLAECGKQDIIIQAAAPADYRVNEVAVNKIKKTGKEPLTLTMIPTTDIAKYLGEQKKEAQTLVGFAAETEHLIENAKKKLESKNLDMIVANDVSIPGSGFDADTNKVIIISKDSSEDLPLQTKAALADIILYRILKLREKGKGLG